MPLKKREVSPVEVSRHRLPQNIRNNELECVSNGTLSNLVRQMSSLSRHAEDIFGELYHEAVKLEHKTNTLLSRVDRLAKKVTQLDSNVEEGEELKTVFGIARPKIIIVSSVFFKLRTVEFSIF